VKDNASLSNQGTVVSVRGSVVDIRFERGLPAIYSLLRTGKDRRIAIEVLAQLDVHRVRGTALTPTQGLARGMTVEDTGGPLKAPVGRGILSRMFDVFGTAIDRQGEVSDVQWRTVHHAPPPLARRSTKSEVFETGIKVIDVLVPLERGGKAGLFGGAGVGKTVLLTEMIHNMVGHLRGRQPVLRHRRTLPRRRGPGWFRGIRLDGADAVPPRLSAHDGHRVIAVGGGWT
jgi:F-type H+-transporting ATPase subunit beta